jgi:ferredoxin--NADP+ reductase
MTPPDSSDEVREIVLSVDPNRFPVQAGQNIGVLVRDQPSFAQNPHLRLYSVVDVPQETTDGHAQIHICVRRCYYIDDYSGEKFPGIASNFLCDLKPGDHLTVTGPYEPPFSLPKDPQATLILIGAGTGIAPFRSLVKAAYQKESGFKGRVWMFYGARTGMELLYMNDVRNDFSQYYDQETFEAIAVLSKRPHWSDALDWNSAFESRSEELWTMLLDPHTCVYVAGTESIRDELDSEFARIAGSAEKWARRKAELQAGGRWRELLY